MERFEQFLQTACEQVDNEFRRRLKTDEANARLGDAIMYALFSGGKRLRPAMALFTDSMFGKSRAALQVACAVEMVHTYSLVHDDLPAMDDDDFRRGRKSLHIAYDEATAILAGDALLTMAFEWLSHLPEYGLRAVRSLQAVQVLAEAAGDHGMVLGQAMDMTLDAAAHAEQITRMHAEKTGKMFIASLKLGCLTGGARPSDQSILAQYGVHFGAAYQAADDIEDAGQTSDMARASLVRAMGLPRTVEFFRRESDLAHKSLAALGDSAWWLHDLVDKVGQKVDGR